MKGQAPLRDQSDSCLLRLGRAGNEEAFLALYHRHSAAIFRFALHMSGRRECAEEVAQEVFLALLEKDVVYDEDRGTMEAFLIGITRNQVRRHRRDDWRVEPIEQGIKIQEAGDELCIENELQALRKAVLALPESYRAVTVLCDLEQLSYAEAAQRLGCAVGTIRSRLHRARAILQTKLRRRELCRATTVR